MDTIEGKELTLLELFGIYKKRRRIIWGGVLLMGTLGALYCTFSTRRYEAIGTVQIQKESSDGLGLDSLMSDAGGAGDSLDANIIIETQASILQSDTLAIRTIEDLRLESTYDFRARWSPLTWIENLFSPRGVSDPKGARLEDSPNRRTRALKVWKKNLTVTPVAGTRLIEIDYLNPDPTVAAAIVNELSKGLIDYTFQTRFNATNQASSWLTGQLTELRTQSEGLQAKVVELERQSGVYSLGTVDAQGRDQAYSGVLDRLQQATIALSVAQQNRILKGAIAQAADSGNAEMLSGLAGNAIAGPTGSPAMTSSLTLIQNLRQQQATEQAALQEAEAKYGSAYPKLSEMRGNLAALEHSVSDEIQRIKKRAESDYAIAVQSEQETQTRYNEDKTQADKLNDKAIEYAIIRDEATKSRDLYEDLLKRLKEAGVLEGLKSSNITIVDPGRTPAKPKKPNVPVYMLVSLVGGFFLGSLTALLVNTLDNKVSSILEVEGITGRSILGATPLVDRTGAQLPGDTSARLLILSAPDSTFAESVRSIRTSVLLTGGGHTSRVILLTSALPGEGKTEISASLAVVLAQANRKVLLIDSDMRKGALRRRMNMPRHEGLSELLSGQGRGPSIQSFSQVPGLDILLAGTPPPNPAELLDSEMSNFLTIWRKQYDFIILDGPPLLPVTDALIMHPMADITLLLTRSGVTERAQLQRSYNMLTTSTKHFVGVVVNGLRPQDENYYGYYGYRKYSYKYGEEHDANS